MTNNDLIFGDGTSLSNNVKQTVLDLKAQWTAIRSDGVIELNEAIGLIVMAGQRIGAIYKEAAIDKQAVKDAAEILYDQVLMPLTNEKVVTILHAWVANNPKMLIRWFGGTAVDIGVPMAEAKIRELLILALDAGLNAIAQMQKTAAADTQSVTLMSCALVRASVAGAGL